MAKAQRKADRIKKKQEALAAGISVEESKESEDEEEEEDVQMEEEPDEEPPTVELTDAEKFDLFHKESNAIPDIQVQLINASFHHFTLPEKEEGFDEVRYNWSDAKLCEEHISNWVHERKLTTRIEDLTPSDWFRGKLQDFQRDLSSWHGKHTEVKDPAKRAALLAAHSAAKAAADAAGKTQEGGAGQEDAENKSASEVNKGAAAEQGKENEQKEEMDPMRVLEDELDKQDFDVFMLDTVADVGSGLPLYEAFQHEDWALLSLRFELHLLCHAFVHDCKDDGRNGIALDHLPYYYNKYYKKSLVPKNYGFDNLIDVLLLIQDTVIVISKVVESQIGNDLETNQVFIKLTEESRRDRQRRIDAGDDSVSLKFNSNINIQFGSGAVPKNGAMGGIMTKAPSQAIEGDVVASAGAVPKASGLLTPRPVGLSSRFPNAVRPRGVLTPGNVSEMGGGKDGDGKDGGLKGGLKGGWGAKGFGKGGMGKGCMNMGGMPGGMGMRSMLSSSMMRPQGMRPGGGCGFGGCNPWANWS